MLQAVDSQQQFRRAVNKVALTVRFRTEIRSRRSGSEMALPGDRASVLLANSIIPRLIDRNLFNLFATHDGVGVFL